MAVTRALTRPRERRRERERERERERRCLATRGCLQEENSWQERDSYDLKIARFTILRSHVWPLKYYWNTSLEEAPSAIYARSLANVVNLLRTTSWYMQTPPPSSRANYFSPAAEPPWIKKFLRNNTIINAIEHHEHTIAFSSLSEISVKRMAPRSLALLVDRTRLEDYCVYVHGTPGDTGKSRAV